MRWRILGPGLLLGVATLLAVHLLLLHTYWNYSEGVYALTAQQMLHGGDLYGRIVGAQPPGVFLVGVGLLAIHDSLEPVAARRSADEFLPNHSSTLASVNARILAVRGVCG